MPIINPEDTTNTVPPTGPDIIETEEKLWTNKDFKTSILFNEDKELDYISNFTAGMQWDVTYFNQDKDVNDNPQMPDINISPTLLQYKKIKNLILFLETPIEQTDPNEITGTGIISAGFVPFFGDPFFATLYGGREAVFVITKVTKKQYNLNDVYYVEFKLFMFLDTDSIQYRDIINKTIRTYVYDKDYATTYSAPIILESDYKDKLDLNKELENIKDFYFRRFLDKEKNVILLPTEFDNYYDQYVFKFIMQIFDFNISDTYYNKFNRLSLDTEHYSIYDYLIDRNVNNFALIEKQLNFNIVRLDFNSPFLRHCYGLGINRIIDKYDDITTYYDDKNILPNPLGSDNELELLKVEDNYYVLSDNFYTNNNELGLIEQAIKDYMDGKTIEINTLYDLINNYKYWTTLHQYNILPILYLLIKDKVNNTFSMI